MHINQSPRDVSQLRNCVTVSDGKLGCQKPDRRHTGSNRFAFRCFRSRLSLGIARRWIVCYQPPKVYRWPWCRATGDEGWGKTICSRIVGHVAHIQSLYFLNAHPNYKQQSAGVKLGHRYRESHPRHNKHNHDQETRCGYKREVYPHIPTDSRMLNPFILRHDHSMIWVCTATRTKIAMSVETARWVNARNEGVKECGEMLTKDKREKDIWIAMKAFELLVRHR